MGGQAGLELADLAVQFGDDGHRGAGGGGKRGTDRCRRGRLLGAQRGLDLTGAGVDIALAPTAFERRMDRRPTQMSALFGGWGAIEHSERVAVGQVVEGHLSLRDRNT